MWNVQICQSVNISSTYVGGTTSTCKSKKQSTGTNQYQEFKFNKEIYLKINSETSLSL